MVKLMEINCISTGSSGNSYIVESQSGKFVLDCGVDFKMFQKGVNFNVGGIDFILFSHAHLDHIHATSLKELIKRGKKLYMPQQAIEKFSLQATRNVFMAAHGQQFAIDNFLIMPFNLVHKNADFTDCENLGYIIYDKMNKEKLVYITDTAYVPSQMPPDINYLLLEVNYEGELTSESYVSSVEKRRYSSHMGLNTAIEFLKTLCFKQMQKIFIIHTSSDRGDKVLIKEQMQRNCGVTVEVF